ncbi:DUF4056 domain-containing protein [uncultured Tateyamaria sp.]|uniref:DUF4056 domain-containing protein n=1 Tax=Tateyamaria sp. 1078 TaxID=3417464 RepID=UPI00260D62F1|nr:DUF4056 domain-containing protein [uncultured Tateyamaria sp.]
MSNPLLDALELARYLLGQISSLLPISEIHFVAPDPNVDFTGLPSFGHVSRPSVRWCCSLTMQGKRSAISLSDVRGTDHVYGSGSTSGSGYVYTSAGGLVDVGHVRDNADMTRYCASQVLQNWPMGGTFSLGAEGFDPASNYDAERIITVKPSTITATPELMALIGARIAYDVAVFHEINTWDDSSSFSPEDNYSNLLGTYIGFLALLSTDDYNTAVNEQLTKLLIVLGAAPRDVTRDVIDYVEDHWFRVSITGVALKRRHFDALVEVPPWQATETQIPGLGSELTKLKAKVTGPSQPVRITVPDTHSVFGDLSQFYELNLVDGGTTVLKNSDFGSHIAGLRATAKQGDPNVDQP